MLKKPTSDVRRSRSRCIWEKSSSAERRLCFCALLCSRAIFAWRWDATAIVVLVWAFISMFRSILQTPPRDDGQGGEMALAPGNGGGSAGVVHRKWHVFDQWAHNVYASRTSCCIIGRSREVCSPISSVHTKYFKWRTRFYVAWSVRDKTRISWDVVFRCLITSRWTLVSWKVFCHKMQFLAET